MDQYYTGSNSSVYLASVQYIFDSVVTELSKDKDRYKRTNHILTIAIGIVMTMEFVLDITRSAKSASSQDGITNNHHNEKHWSNR